MANRMTTGRRSTCVAWAAVALGALLLLCGGMRAFAQSSDQRLIDELVRKAEDAESAGGFCARTGWPAGDSVAGFTKFLDGAKAGSWKVSTFASGACVYNSVTEVHDENGGKCVSYTFYTCPREGTCGVGKSIDCLDGNGRFVSRRDVTD